MSIPQRVRADFENGTTRVPKAGDVRTVFSRRFEGRIKTCTFSREVTGKWFVSYLVDDGKDAPEKVAIDHGKAVGVDLGVTEFAVLSSGERIFETKLVLCQSLDLRSVSPWRKLPACDGQRRLLGKQGAYPTF